MNPDQSKKVDPSAWKGRELTPIDWRWGADQTILYALGVGASPPRDLELVYEGSGPRVLPGFGNVPTSIGFMPMVEELGLDLLSILHGEQTLRLHRSLPVSGSAVVNRRIRDVWDKGSGAVIVLEEQAVDGDPLLTCTSSWFVRGAGGFGGERGPSSAGQSAPPQRSPDAGLQHRVRPDQSALYRLSGDRNPIHIDAEVARAAGHPDIFLHGLCTLGIVGLELAMEVYRDRMEAIREISARFTAPVYMGDELTLNVWQVENGAMFEAFVESRQVLAAGRVTF